MDNKKTISKGLIISLTFTSLFIVSLIVGAFLLSENKFFISGSIIILLCLLVVLVLSTSFDNFSIGKIFSLSREVEEKKIKIDSLEKERTELYLKIINMNYQSQASSVTVNNSVPDANQNLVVDKLNEDEKKKKTEEDEFENHERRNTHKRLNSEKFENLILSKYFGTSKDDSELLREVKVVDQFTGLDSISNKPVYFDAYLKDNNSETFIDIRKDSMPSVFFHDRLYVQLNKILLYRQQKGNNAQLLLIIVKEKDAQERQRSICIEDFFSPARYCELLKIVYIYYTKEEYETCLEERQ